ncbi:MAG TPA: hypothetical protein VGG19_18305 [Tepidisphaeraceae bacterium]|jgi:hypothetical protein
MKTIVITIVAIASAIILAIAGIVAYFFFGFQYAIHKLNAVPLSSDNYRPSAVELIKICQSDPRLFSDEATKYLDPFDPVWAPPSVAKLHPEVIEIAPDQASVTWGGGFYHCGWKLVRGSSTANGLSHTWTLWFYSEDHSDEFLEKIDVANDQRFSEDQFIHYVLAEVDRRLASHLDDGLSTSEADWYLAAGRCTFLEQHHRLDLLPQQVRVAATSYPHDWRDILLCYLLDHEVHNAAASDKLRQWADQTGGQAAWMYAAYAFYQSGDSVAGDNAIKKALATTSADPDWIDNDIPIYELGMAVRLYQTGYLSECGRFCDGILTSAHRYFTTKSAVQSMRNIATSSAASRPANLPTFDKYTSLDAFGDMNLQDFYAAAIPPTTTRPAHP